MKFLQVMIISLSILLQLLPLLVAESSSLANVNFISNNITRGSSLYSNDTSPYWLSPSGHIAFGFYLLPCKRSSPECTDRFLVGVWFVKSPQKTLVWSVNRTIDPLYKPSSIHFTHEGKLLLRLMPDNKDKLLLPDVPEPASYAKMRDDGNFVLYGSESQIVWESFDYPTDTIVGGQKLRADLISGDHRLSVGQTDGSIAVYHLQGYQTGKIFKVVSDEIEGSVSTPVSLKLDTTGNLYLIGSDEVVLKYLYRNKNPHQKQHDEGSIGEDGVHIYRASLNSEGDFKLYKERISGNISSSDHNDKSSSILVLLWPIYKMSKLAEFALILFDIIGLTFISIMIKNWCQERKRKKAAEKEIARAGDLELGKS